MSQYNEWERCPLAYQSKRLLGTPELPAAWTIQGTAVHSAVEAWELSGRAITIHEAQQLYYTTYDALIAEQRERFPRLSDWLRGGRKSTEADITDRRELGAVQVREYILHSVQEGYEPVIINGEPAVELQVTLTEGDLSIVGYIDVLLRDGKGQLRIRDLKTGERPAWDIQLYTYRWALLETYQLDVRWGDYWLAKKTALTDPIDLGRSDRHELLCWYRQVDREIEQGHYRPRPGRHCFTCNVKHTCPWQA